MTSLDRENLDAATAELAAIAKGTESDSSTSGKPKSHRTEKRSRKQRRFHSGGNPRDPLNISNAKPGDKPPEMYVDDFPLKINTHVSKKDPLNIANVELDIKKKRHLNEDVEECGSHAPRKVPRYDSKSSEVNAMKHDEQAPESSFAGSAGNSKQPENRMKKEFFNNKYCYGNFDRYYGSRLAGGSKDERLRVLPKEWFERRSVLDIGCNVGYLTLSIAKEYCPRRILGIDIDAHLVGVARKNIRHYCDSEMPLAGKFPASFAVQFGPISQHSRSFSTKFPDNVWFRQENYVLHNDELLDTVEEEYDVIMALSVSKWIHLNWADEGMRRFFKRVHANLLPGGRFILEPQPIESYRKRSKMTARTAENYAKIEFKPDDFEMYLLEECGFESVLHLGAPQAKSKGFCRPIDVYVKKAAKFRKPPKKGDGNVEK